MKMLAAIAVETLKLMYALCGTHQAHSARSSKLSSFANDMVVCPMCSRLVRGEFINEHIDSNCEEFVTTPEVALPTAPEDGGAGQVASLFKPPAKKVTPPPIQDQGESVTPPPTQDQGKKITPPSSLSPSKQSVPEPPTTDNAQNGSPTSNKKTSKESPKKRLMRSPPENGSHGSPSSLAKRVKFSDALQKAAPLAERMRPRTLDEIQGQALVGPDGVLRGLIEADRVPSMILWGGCGIGKTTIARVIASTVKSRFIEINSTSSGVAECKKIFAKAKGDLEVMGRKTILFCDEFHHFSKSQQDVFLEPVESGHVTLIGATTENPSFKVQNTLLSRCRTFALQKLTNENVTTILRRALALEQEDPVYGPTPLVDDSLLEYLSAFSDGDARTALNLLELALSLANRQGMTVAKLKSSLTQTLVYDRAGDNHYHAISALHKSIRGSDPHASLFWLTRMFLGGEDPLYIARRLIVIASEDVGLADNTMLPLALAAHAAAEKVGMPEVRVNLAHATVALALAPKSTRAYRGWQNAEAALMEAGVAGLPVPVHLRNAPTNLMKEMGYGRDYKYNPSYRDGLVKQEYLPEEVAGRKFLEDLDLGTDVDPEYE